jgi:hypothetical protein
VLNNPIPGVMWTNIRGPQLDLKEQCDIEKQWYLDEAYLESSNKGGLKRRVKVKPDEGPKAAIGANPFWTSQRPERLKHVSCPFFSLSRIALPLRIYRRYK